MRDAGAREVHLRISAPPTTGPCYYGIDTPTREELIEHERELVQGLVDGIAGSGLWLDEDMNHRLEAAEVACHRVGHIFRGRLRFVATRLVEGAEDRNLADSALWTIHDRDEGHYVHALAGIANTSDIHRKGEAIQQLRSQIPFLGIHRTHQNGHG